MIKNRLLYALCFTLTAVGVFFSCLCGYYLLCEPETLTTYEMWMTFGFSAFVADRLYRRTNNALET